MVLGGRHGTICSVQGKAGNLSANWMEHTMKNWGVKFQIMSSGAMGFVNPADL